MATKTGNGKKRPAKQAGIDVDAAVVALNKRTAELARIADAYARQRYLQDEHGNGGGVIYSTIFSACLDHLNRDSREEAKKQLARAAAIEAALKVLGVTDVPHNGYVHPHRMAREELAGIDPHFVNMTARLGGIADVIPPITALKQMVIDLHEWAAELRKLRKDNAFFFYLGRRFAQAGLKPPVKVQTLSIYRVLCEAVKEAGGAQLPEYPFMDYEKPRAAIARGSKAATL